MAEAMLAEKPKWEPRVIKISSKRQITIPADVYEESGFAQYALLSRTLDGFSVQPVNVYDEDATVQILRHLLAQGFDGEALIDEYEKINKKLVEFERLIGEGLRDADEGRVVPFDVMQEELRAKYGL